MAEKYNPNPIFTASDLIAHLSKKGNLPRFPLPQGMIFCYQPGLLERAAKRYALKKVSSFFGDCFLIKNSGGKVAICANFGIGAPVAVVLMEQYAALGVRNFISIGMAGGLQTWLEAGDLVLCTQALRDEGTSFHYIEPTEFASAQPEITSKFKQSLERSGRPFHMGSGWTTDAPFRESQSEVEQHREEGVLAVDMEAAALFAAGQVLNLQVAAAFAIGDSLVETHANGMNRLHWRLDFDQRNMYLGLETLLDAAVQCLAGD